MTMVKSSNNSIEVRSKRIGKAGGSEMNDTNDNVVSQSNIWNGKVNCNNFFIYNKKKSLLHFSAIEIPILSISCLC